MRGNKVLRSMRSSVAVAVLAIAFSGGAFLQDAMPPIFTSQAFAANANSKGNGKSDSNNGNGGRSADAGSGSANESSSGGPASSQGNGGGLLRLLATGSARPSSTDSTAPAGVAAGAPLQLLPSRANGAAPAIALVGPPDPKPVAPVTAYVMETAEATGQKPGEIHRLLGAGHSYFNSNEQAKLHAAYDSRIKRVERYLLADWAAQEALATNGGVLPSEQDYLDAQAYLDAVAVLANPASTAEQIAAANATIAGFPLLDPATAQLVVDGYEAEATAIAAFEEADNQPYDDARRDVYDDIALYLGLTF